MNKPKAIVYERVSYQRNADLGIDPECHECISHKTFKTGYPRMAREGFYHMHRYLYFRSTGESPEVVMHLCDNPKCINLKHLKAGTHADNVRDKCIKGRATGGKAGKLSGKDMKDIRKKVEAGIPCNAVSKKYGVSDQTISKVMLGQIGKLVRRSN